LEELPLPSVGASFKKWGSCTPILPKALAHFPNFQKLIFFKIKKFQKNWDSPAGTGIDLRPAGDRWSPAGPRLPTCGRTCSGRRPTVARQPQVNAWTCRAVPIFVEFFFLLALHFLLKWSTLSHWL
jgi:hypothetical protein